MPAVSKKQQRLFAIVHGYQTGKIPANKVSPRIKKIAKSISQSDAKKYATTQHTDLKEILSAVLNSPAYVVATLQEIVETNTPNKVRGVLIDVFTAKMITFVMGKLNEENKKQFLSKPINEMVAVSYKILTY